MLKKFIIPCDFAGVKAPFNIYVGDPRPDRHPVGHQADWLSRERGGTVPPEVMNRLQKLLDTAKENNVSFEELCVHEMGGADGGNPDGGNPADTAVEPAQA